MAKIKVFQKAKSQGKGHKVKQYGTKKERSSPSIQSYGQGLKFWRANRQTKHYMSPNLWSQSRNNFIVADHTSRKCPSEKHLNQDCLYTDIFYW